MVSKASGSKMTVGDYGEKSELTCLEGFTEQDLKELSWILSHEIRSSLVQVLSLINDLKEEASADYNSRFIEVLELSASKMDLDLKRLVGKLESFSTNAQMQFGSLSKNKPWKVLVVDDDPIMNSLAIRHVNSFGLQHDTLSYKSGKEFLDYLRNRYQEEPAGIMVFMLLDINMPEVNGWDVLEVIRKEKLGSNFQVVMYSSSICPNERRRAMKYPFVRGFIEKPMSKGVLEEFFYSVRLM